MSVMLQTCPKCGRDYCVEERGLDDVHCQDCWELLSNRVWWKHCQRLFDIAEISPGSPLIRALPEGMVW